MERKIQAEVPSPSCRADECLREHHEAITGARRKPGSNRQHWLYNHDIFSFTVPWARSDFHPSICFASSIKSATRNCDRPAAIATNGSTAPMSVQLIGKECRWPSFLSWNQTLSSPQF